MEQPKWYRKKPVAVQAMQFTKYNGEDVANWIRENKGVAKWGRMSEDDQFIDIITLEGVMTANLDDLIIKGIKGEFYPCKPDIFSDTYEAVIPT